jgi:dTDP-4-amino-4,6-dideoxygalactose transaminase
MADASYVPFHRPSIGEDEMRAVQEVLASGWLTTGPKALAFEHEFAQYIGCRHAIAVNSGTAALQLALDSIGLKPGDEVLVPTYTFTATAEVVSYFGARPILCDSVPGGFNIDPADAERRITQRTRAILPVHVAGEPCAMDRLHAIAAAHGLHVIEDAAHALPATHQGKRVGTISELTAFSFYATKTITTGEGGILTTDNERYAERASVMRLHGIGGDAWKRYSRTGSWAYEVLEAGYKLNLTDMAAAMGRVQLKRCDSFWRRRCQISNYYSHRFSRFGELQLPPDIPQGSEHAWHLYIVRLRRDSLGLERDQFIEELKKMGIGSSVHFIPLHRHPFYARTYGYSPGDFPNADDAFSRCISLPIFPDMKDEEIERVAEAVESLIAKHLNRAAMFVS